MRAPPGRRPGGASLGTAFPMKDILIEPQKANIQGLVLRGYTHPFSCHFLFGFPQKTNPQKFFRTLYSRVQNACDWGTQKPAQLLNIGLTYGGIAQLGVLAGNELATFPTEFREGPWSADSQLSLGDTAASAGPKGAAANPNDPSHWWGGNFANTDLHCVVHAYALTQADLDELTAFIEGAAAAGGVQELFPRAGSRERLTQYQLQPDYIHFGYHDGISEPRLARSNGDPYSFRRQADLPNFLIGYCPQVALTPPGPQPPQSGTVGVAAAEFAHDGCYNAFRILYQDVAAFNNLLASQADAVAQATGRTPADAQEWLAAKLVGRWRNGSPLMASPNNPQGATEDAEGFCYIQPPVFTKQPLPAGTPADVFSTYQCPFAAHTRIANPRDEFMSPGEGMTPPRIIRRGMPYGPPLTTTTDDGVDRGLIGLFLCGSLAGQFEKVYGWINAANFATSFPPTKSSQYTYPQDALLGNRVTLGGEVNTSFSIPLPNAAQPLTINNLPALTITRGTAYCLLPSLSTLRQLAGS